MNYHSNKPVIPRFNSLAKPDLIKVSDKILNLVENGQMNPLEAFAIAKGLDFVARKIISQTEPNAIDKAIEYHKEDRSILGAKFAYVEGGALYDYDSDEEYRTINEALKIRKALLDSAIKAGHKIVEDDEIIEPPPIKGYKKNYLRFDF